ncbi:dimethyl sulfoxide reductase anchor subunit family protein [Arcanobacterium bovis]|uniref:Dimethyl sulfoxide reductase n=1 Tax=Arcanobacterium bovis TaxID=2529275 RepID=A0A4V2KR10_9ACTO|nr:DmsC/YnfH family molybdoenzyme membrane anchor subunit [Arcanobacterium bovis]TBW21398.1 dimethyl sulfoxide reductase [Arcanobacterium bovis]
MNVHELPMILFTVIAQMCVGAFIILGVMQLRLAAKHGNETVERLTLPVLYAIGPIMILGLIVSMFHMNDPFHVLNVLRHWNSSWLTREILFGTGFAGLGFVFAFMQWFQIGSTRIRMILGILTGLVGIGLIISMTMIYMVLKAVPAWSTPATLVFFFATTLLLGALIVAAALMVTTMVRFKKETKTAPVEVPAKAPAPAKKDTFGWHRNAQAINAPTTEKEWGIIANVVRALTVTAAVVATIILITYIIHIANLATGNPTAQAAAGVFASGFFYARLILLAGAGIVMAIYTYKIAGQTLATKPAPLAWLVIGVFAIVLISELMGRSLHYDSLVQVGI